MSTTRQRAARRTVAPPRRRWSPPLVAGAAIIVVVVIGAWILLRPSSATNTSGPGGLPGPIGGSSVAMDVNTLVGKPAPAFTLPDSEGQSYAITPGQSKPIVLISHMGIT